MKEGFMFDFKKYVTPEAIQYNEILDFLFGRNYYKQNIAKAMELATQRKHPESVWLTLVVPDKANWNLEGIRECMKRHAEKNKADEGKVFYFLAFFEHPFSRKFTEFINIAKKEKHVSAFIDSLIYITGEYFYEFCVAAEHGERLGFYYCGLAFSKGMGCNENFEKSQKCFEIAYALGFVDAAQKLSTFYDIYHIKHWEYFSFLANEDLPYEFESGFLKIIPEISNIDFIMRKFGSIIMLIG